METAATMDTVTAAATDMVAETAEADAIRAGSSPDQFTHVCQKKPSLWRAFSFLQFLNMFIFQ